MATRDIVPRADSEGGIGTSLKRWASGWFDAINGKDISGGVATAGELTTHTGNTSNPHSVTKAQVGLGNCDNTADASKPVSSAQQTALDGKVSHSLATAANDMLVASGAGAFVKKTLAEVKTILGLGTAAYTASTDYAAAAKGVTNGDSHDHSGGDGGQISHAALSSIGTNTHAQIDTHLASTSNPHGVTADQTGAKGLISANTTIYVATTGSDTTGTGASGTPYASIAKALSSIASKLIASGVIVTISVADGTYNISSTIVVDHPDADKIRILGNTSAETTVAITTIDTTAKTITVAGNYVSNADATKNIVSGDIIGLTGSSTSGLNGAYLVSGVSYDGANTVVTCSSETIASSTVGGGGIVIKPSNKCVLNISSSVWGFNVSTVIKLLAGFRINCNGPTIYVPAVYIKSAKYLGISSCIFYGASSGSAIWALTVMSMDIDGCIFKGQSISMMMDASFAVKVGYNGKVIFDNIGSNALYITNNSGASMIGTNVISRSVITTYSPAANVVGNGNSYIAVA